MKKIMLLLLICSVTLILCGCDNKFIENTLSFQTSDDGFTYEKKEHIYLKKDEQIDIKIKFNPSFRVIIPSLFYDLFDHKAIFSYLKVDGLTLDINNYPAYIDNFYFENEKYDEQTNLVNVYYDYSLIESGEILITLKYSNPGKYIISMNLDYLSINFFKYLVINVI